MSPVRYRVASMTNVTVLRRDHITCKDVPVAIDEDIRPEIELRVILTPGQTSGSYTLVKREDDANSDAVTREYNHPGYQCISNLFAGLIDTTLHPYSEGGYL